MARTRYRIFETEYPYLITCTIAGWLPIFTRQESVNIVYDSWRYLQRERNLLIFGYVILENHLHVIAKAPELAKVVQTFKSFTARKTLDLLEANFAETLLRQLRAEKKRHKTESHYQLWQEGGKPKQIQNDEMLWQKLEYVHLNPVKRGYVDDPLHWRYSSARNYAKMPGLIDVVVDWM
jgi:putative transposase